MLVDMEELRDTPLACDNFGYAPTVAEFAAERRVPEHVMRRAMEQITETEGMRRVA